MHAPIHRRPLDLALVSFFSVSVLYGFLFSLPEGYFLAFNLPWLIAPAVLGARVFLGRDLRTADG